MAEAERVAEEAIAELATMAASPQHVVGRCRLTL